MFIVNFDKRLAQKFHTTILLQIGLIISIFHFPQIQQILIFMVFGPSGRVHDSQIQL